MQNFSYSNKQQGAALIVSLVILLLMMILGLAAIRTSSMEEKMAGNTMDLEIAFQAAETALRTGEAWIATLSVEPEATTDGSNIVWVGDAMDPDSDNAKNWWQEQTGTWWTSNAVQVTNAITFESTAGTTTIVNPRYIIEYQQFVNDDLLVGTGGGPSTGRVFYRITARGTGGSANSRILLQSTMAKRF
jgi:type IV pilus assembly protein PilX